MADYGKSNAGRVSSRASTRDPEFSAVVTLEYIDSGFRIKSGMTKRDAEMTERNRNDPVKPAMGGPRGKQYI